MNNESKEIPVRNQWIDIVKSVAIISVVVGHVLSTNNYFDAGIDEIRRFIYTYHLVVLFWITGYCWKRKNLSEFHNKTIKDLYKICTLCNRLISSSPTLGAHGSCRPLSIKHKRNYI